MAVPRWVTVTTPRSDYYPSTGHGVPHVSEVPWSTPHLSARLCPCPQGPPRRRIDSASRSRNLPAQQLPRSSPNTCIGPATAAHRDSLASDAQYARRTSRRGAPGQPRVQRSPREPGKRLFLVWVLDGCDCDCDCECDVCDVCYSCAGWYGVRAPQGRASPPRVVCALKTRVPPKHPPACLWVNAR